MVASWRCDRIACGDDEEEAARERAKWLELCTNARQLDEIYTPRNKVTPAALAMVMSAQGVSLDHRSAGQVSRP
jgi:hypothetical protein